MPDKLIRVDSPHGFEILPSAARTTAPTISTFQVGRVGGLIVVIDVTVDPASASLVFDIEGVDAFSGKFFNILTSAAIAATGTTVLRVSPHLTAAANLIAKDVVPPAFRMVATPADTDSMTYSISGFITG